MTTCSPASSSTISCHWKDQNRNLERTQGQAVTPPVSEAKDNSTSPPTLPPTPAWPHLIKTFYSDPIKASSSLKLPALTSQVHTITLINLLCSLNPSVTLLNPFLFCDKNLDGDEASLTSLVPPLHQFPVGSPYGPSNTLETKVIPMPGF